MDEEEKKEVENMPAKGRQAYIDYMKGRDAGYNADDEDSMFDDMLQYRQTNDRSREQMAEALSSDPRLAQVMGDIVGKKRGAGASFARYFGKDLLSAEEGTPEWDELQQAEKERQDEIIASTKRAEEYNRNIEASQPVLEKFAKDKKIDIDDFLEKAYDQIIAPIFQGKYSEEVLNMLNNALNYEKDVQDSFDAGQVAGKNQKIDKMMRSNKGDGMPRLGASAGQAKQPSVKKGSMYRPSVWDV